MESTTGKITTFHDCGRSFDTQTFHAKVGEFIMSSLLPMSKRIIIFEEGGSLLKTIAIIGLGPASVSHWPKHLENMVFASLWYPEHRINSINMQTS